MTLIRLMPLAVLLTVTGCTKPWSSKYEYTCADDYTFTIRYAGTKHPGDIALFEDETRSVKLPRVPSASGERYSNEALEYFAKGDEAMIIESGVITHRDCSTEPPEDDT